MLLTVLLVSFSQVSADAIRDFSAVAEGNTVTLQWTSNSESNIVEYRLQRSFDGRNFYDLSTIEPEGSGHTYRYTDNDLFKNEVRTFYYRIEIRLNNGQSQYSRTERVTLSFSSIHRTWGSIKAMFR